MNTTIHKFTLFFTTCLLACPIGHAAEQDNWYLANEWSVSDAKGVAYYEDNATGIGQIYIANGVSTSAKISVFDLNGSLNRDIVIANSRYYANDLAIDTNGTLYIGERYAVTCLENDGTFKWRIGKGNTSILNYGSSGSGDGEFDKAKGIAVHPSSGEVFVAEELNRRVQVFDKDGNFIRKFGSNGTAPGQLQSVLDLAFLKDGRLVVSDTKKLHWFNADGTFIKRTADFDPYYVSVSLTGLIFAYDKAQGTYKGSLFDAEGDYISTLGIHPVHHRVRSAFTPSGDFIDSYNNKIRIWKRAYRTKGLPVRNVIPQPAVRGITQRAGTNIIDIDFEIIDQDDVNATVGILAAQDGASDDISKWILPQTWVDGTGSKIGTPIATNQVHRVSWNVKPDWPDSTGTLKFEIICHDARRTAPVDLHFLTLPLPDGNLTISRSPLKDSDFESYAKCLLTTGQAELNATSNEVQLPPATVPSGDFVFTSAGKTGKDGPTSAEVNASYVGTPLEGNVTMTTQGIQEWTVPETGVYSIEAAGARGGLGGLGALPGFGSRLLGKFNLTAGITLNIVVGQAGGDGNGWAQGGGGAGGSFVWIQNSASPIMVAGGGAGGTGHSGANGNDGSLDINGTDSSDGVLGGKDGNHGNNASSSDGAGGGSGWLGSSTEAKAGKKFTGGDWNRDGGFGGGGGADRGAAGGGGYSGGAGSNGYHESGGSGGSFNSGSEKLALVNESKNGFIRIRKIQANTPLAPSTLSKLLYDDRRSSGSLRFKLEQVLGASYRIATPEEVQKAREAATAGGVNQWTANRPVQPRNLPNKVNEYGFDTGNHGNRAWWIVQE